MAEQWNNQSFRKSAIKHYKACSYLLKINSSISPECRNHVYSDIYYLCGYVIECSLKYYIMKSKHYDSAYSKSQLEEMGLKTHSIYQLHALASDGSCPISFKWKDLSSSIKKWNVQVRYDDSNNGFASEIQNIKKDIDLVYSSVFNYF